MAKKNSSKKLQKLPKLSRINSNKGVGLVEVLVATAVVGVVMTAIASGLLLSVKNTALSKYRSLANSKAQEGLEIFRKEKSILGWTSFLESVQDGTICMNTLPAPTDQFNQYIDSNSAPCSTGVAEAGTEFVREADITINPSNTEVRVEIIVTWTDAGDERSVSFVQEFREY